MHTNFVSIKNTLNFNHPHSSESDFVPYKKKKIFQIKIWINLTKKLPSQPLCELQPTMKIQQWKGHKEKILKEEKCIKLSDLSNSKAKRLDLYECQKLTTF